MPLNAIFNVAALLSGRIRPPSPSLVRASLVSRGRGGTGRSPWVAVTSRGRRHDVRVVRRVDARRRVRVLVCRLRSVATAAVVPARVAVPQVPELELDKLIE